MNTHTPEWTRIVAHEMRNSIAAVTAGLDLLQSRGADPEVLADVSGLMKHSLHQLARLVSDLQDEHQSAQRRFALVQKRFDLIPVVRQAVGAARSLIESRGHLLIEQLPPLAPVVEGDPDRLVQVFVNLLENAARYTEPGGRITLNVERNATAAVVQIQDNGIGITPELLPHVFDIYVRGATQTAFPDGAGIGLAVAHQIIEAHAGRLSAHSDGPGKGSTFTVELPVVEDADESERHSASLPQRPCSQP